jgi:CheY-like chemotaxis protein
MQRKYRFTLADDDAALLFFTHSLVSQAYPGSSFASFTNAQDALQHILATGADLVITDHGMGEMNGTEMIRQLRKHGFHHPIIMVSGTLDAERDAMAAGATAFIEKSVAGPLLVGKIKKFLPTEIVGG